MRCNICDSSLANPKFNRDLRTWEPCETCLEVISDCINDLKDNAVWYEEDLDDAFSEATISPKINKKYDFT